MTRHVLGLLLVPLAMAAAAGGARYTAAAGAAKAPPRLDYALTTIGRFDSPVHVTAPPGDARRLFVVEKKGRIDKDENARLVEYRRSSSNSNRADPGSRREVLLVRLPSGEHYGGMLLFGPDRRLYLGIGDGGLKRLKDQMRAQRDGEVHGKLVTVNRRHADRRARPSQPVALLVRSPDR